MSDYSDAIGQGWDRYRHRAVPAGAGPVQITETRDAFYAGGSTVLNAVLGILGSATGNHQVEQELQAIHEELSRFLVELAQRGPGPYVSVKAVDRSIWIK